MLESLPAWVIDDRKSVEAEAANFRDMEPDERLKLLAAACRGAARMLRLRDDREHVLLHVDPLPESSRRVLERLRRELASRQSPDGSP